MTEPIGYADGYECQHLEARVKDGLAEHDVRKVCVVAIDAVLDVIEKNLVVAPLNSINIGEGADQRVKRIKAIRDAMHRSPKQGASSDE